MLQVEVDPVQALIDTIDHEAEMVHAQLLIDLPAVGVVRAINFRLA